MKTALTLALFHLRSRFWSLLFQLAIYLWICLVFYRFFASGVDLFTLHLMVRQVSLPVMIVFSIGIALAGGGPRNEFLLTRPATRRQVYGAALLLFFLMALVPPAAAWGWTLADPGLRIAVMHSPDATALSATFPGASVEGKTILVPQGKALLQGWQLWIVALGFLAAQILFLLPIPQKVYRFVVFVPLFLFLFSNVKYLDRPTPAFAFFTHHWPPLVAATVLLFAAVQALAWWRAVKVEVD